MRGRVGAKSGGREDHVADHREVAFALVDVLGGMNVVARAARNQSS